MKAAASLAAIMAWAGALRPAHACGACVEDKVAATYDHAVVQRAARQARVLVFCEVRGPLDARRLKTAAAHVEGMDAASLRISAEPAALSFAIDRTRRSPQSAAAALQALAPRGTRLEVIRVLEPSPRSATVR